MMTRVRKFWALPGFLWVAALTLLPLLLMVGVSLTPRGDYGELQWGFTLENYKRLAGFGDFGFRLLYPVVILRSFLAAGAIVAITTVLAIPLCLGILSLSKRWHAPLLILSVLPIWMNLLVRTYGWQIILSPGGFVANTLQRVHLIAPGQSLYPSWPAVWIGLLFDYLPFMVLPVYAAAEKLDWALVDAAKDLGASGFSVFRHAIWPQLEGAVLTGALLTGLPATGQFVIPDLLGGGKTALIGNLLQQQFTGSRDWPFGSSAAVILILATAVILWVFRLFRRKESL